MRMQGSNLHGPRLSAFTYTPPESCQLDQSAIRRAPDSAYMRPAWYAGFRPLRCALGLFIVQLTASGDARLSREEATLFSQIAGIEPAAHQDLRI